jgi:hypothetical protein
MAVAMGALCTSRMDLPSPLRHKFNEMLAGVLTCSLVALLVSLCTPLQRLHLLQQDAAQVALSSAAIDDVLGQADHRPASKTARAGWN